MKVFIVSHGDYSDYEIAGVFSTRERAEGYINDVELQALRAQHPDAVLVAFRGHHIHYSTTPFNDIEEFDVDVLPATKYRVVKSVELYGEAQLLSDYPEELVGPEAAFADSIK